MGFIRNLFADEFLDATMGKWPGAGYGVKRKDRPAAIRIFKSTFLEMFSKAPPITPLIWYGPFTAYGLYKGFTGMGNTVLGTLGLFVAGWVIWTLIEYLLHRFIMHMKFGTSPNQRLTAYIVHEYHHDFPNDPLRLVLPPMIIWPLSALVAWIYYLTLGPSMWAQIFAGTAAGYVTYDLIHYYTHHARPTSKLGKFLRRYHMRHHFKEHNAAFGISAPFWDVAFGTFVDGDANEAATET